jgi:adenosine deaminase
MSLTRPAPVAGCVCPDLVAPASCITGPGQRCVAELPKAHLHLHLTGGMRHGTLLDLAAARGVGLPERLLDPSPLHLDVPHQERSWFRFQHLYDAARRQVSGPDALRRMMAEMCADEAAEGSGWVELQVDPSGYASTFGGLHEVLDSLLDAAADASTASGVGVGLVVAANRTAHPLTAATLARLAAQYAPGAREDRGAAGLGVVPVVGFGLSNNEAAGPAGEFATAFRIARRAGLSAVPHAGELAGSASVRAAVEILGAARVGHGVRAAEDPEVLALMADRGVAAEVCPSSNLALGVFEHPSDVPLARLLAAGVPVALGADDPLLFGTRLGAQYRIAREVHGLDDAVLAALARDSIRASHAPADRRAALLAGVDGWLDDRPVDVVA